ncbi:MAG TPA: hypothetical protein VK122_11515 [Brachybacterium sp.]|nr:hypothetical protein [Brachybacterium sp.]
MGEAQPGEMNIDGTLFTFPEDWDVTVFDRWPQYQRPAGALGLLGCDVLALDGETLWIIEMKDYTYAGARPPDELTRTVGGKAAGTMAVLFALQRAEAQSNAAQFAQGCAAATRIHLALHVDIKDGGRKSKHIEPMLATLQGKLRQVRKALGLSKCYVTSTLAPHASAPWSARRDPDTRHRHEDR